MANHLVETSLILKKESIYDKIRKSLCIFFFQRDDQMIQRLDGLMKIKRPKQNDSIIIPREIGKDITKL